MKKFTIPVCALVVSTSLAIPYNVFGSKRESPIQSNTKSSNIYKDSEIEKRVKNVIINVLAVEEKDVTLKSKFVDDFGADSLDVVEIVMELEKEFNITVPDEDVEKISTVKDAVDYIKTSILLQNQDGKRLQNVKQPKSLPSKSDDLAFVSDKIEKITAESLKSKKLRDYHPELGLRFKGISSSYSNPKSIVSLSEVPCPTPNGTWNNVNNLSSLVNNLITHACSFEAAYKGDYISGYKITEFIIEKGGSIAPEIDFEGVKGHWYYLQTVVDINHRDNKSDDTPYFTFYCGIKTISKPTVNTNKAAEAINNSFVKLKNDLIAKGFELEKPSSPYLYICSKDGIRIKLELFLDQNSPLDSHLKITEYNFKK